MCVCVCERVLRVLAELVCPQDLWVSSCVGNMTLRPQPVAADGNSTTAKRKRGARRKCCYHQLAQWLSHEQSVRRVQQQERVGVHVGCTEAPQVWEGECSACVHESMLFRYVTCINVCWCVRTCMLACVAHTWRTWSPEHFLRPSSCLFVQPSERTLRSLCCFSPDCPAINV